MNKTKDMAMVIEELRIAATAINGTANWLAEQFCNDESVPEKTAPAEPVLTLEAVRAVLADISRAGHTAEVRELLLKHGAAKLSEINPAEYPLLLADAEELTNAT